MGIGIDEAQVELSAVVRGFLDGHDVLSVARSMLEEGDEELPGFFDEMVELGLLGLHLPRASAPRASRSPSWSWSSRSWAAAWRRPPARHLHRLRADRAALGTEACASAGSRAGQRRRTGRVAFADAGLCSGRTLDGEVLCASARHATLGCWCVGDDLLLVELDAGASSGSPSRPSTPTRRARRSASARSRSSPARSSRGAPRGAPPLWPRWPGRRRSGRRRCLDESVSYAKAPSSSAGPCTCSGRQHHAADMLVALELTTAAVWDAARAGGGADDEQVFGSPHGRRSADDVAAFHAPVPNIQLPRRHRLHLGADAHLFLRRAVRSRRASRRRRSDRAS